MPQNVARRLIAVMLTFVFCLLILVASFAYPFSHDYSMFLLSLIREALLPAVGVILAFYFTIGAVRVFKGGE